jgi:hypothetical protein
LSRSARHLQLAGTIGSLIVLASCRGASPVEVQGRSIVYGTDNRVDVFDIDQADTRRLVLEAMVALVPTRLLEPHTGRLRADVPAAGASAGLCEGQRFSSQPAGAFCSGVLVDWDLVLTAGHCARLFGPQDFVVMFDYYLVEPDQLAPGFDSVRNVARIVDEDGRDDQTGVDYAWLRLQRPVGFPRRPAPLARRIDDVGLGQPMFTISTPWGTPFKLDEGGQIRHLGGDTRQTFLADSDTSGGSSGGGAFLSPHALLGILSGGLPDKETTAAGCSVETVEADAELGRERFTYAARALEALCRKNPTATSLCRPDCPEPCEALTAPEAITAPGCGVAGPGRPGSLPVLVVVWACLGLLSRKVARSADAPAVEAELAKVPGAIPAG